MKRRTITFRTFDHMRITDLTEEQIENLSNVEIRQISYGDCALCNGIDECSKRTVRECKDILMANCKS